VVGLLVICQTETPAVWNPDDEIDSRRVAPTLLDLGNLKFLTGIVERYRPFRIVRP
jgi:hypothetical protein